MKNARFIILPALAGIGLLAGGLYKNMKQADGADAPQTEASPELPQEEIRTDAFSLKLFQQVLSEQSGNVLVAPRVVSNTLHALRELAGGESAKELDALQLSQTAVLRTPEPERSILLAIDINVPRTENRFNLVPLPFSEDVPRALSLFNGFLAPSADALFATTDMVSTRTRLLAGAAAYCHTGGYLPFHPTHSRTADFDSASGGMPHYQQMRSRGQYLTARAEDGSWQAVALLLKQNQPAGIPLALIGILPSDSARTFATQLTLEQLSSIRSALAKAAPEDTLVEFPRLKLEVRPYDMRYTLRRLGLASLFHSEQADFSPLTPGKIHLNALIHASGVTIDENRRAPRMEVSELDQAGRIISFSRPFIWLLADLSTDTPMEYMGLVEEM